AVEHSQATGKVTARTRVRCAGDGPKTAHLPQHQSVVVVGYRVDVGAGQQCQAGRETAETAHARIQARRTEHDVTQLTQENDKMGDDPETRRGFRPKLSALSGGVTRR